VYEIWLMLNIVWEVLLAAWPLVLALALAIAVLGVAALRRPGVDWPGAARIALPGAVVVGLLSFVALPSLTSSSLGELNYWVDWLALAGIAAAFGAVSAALLLPLAALTRRKAA
jgi:hypothetical protein